MLRSVLDDHHIYTRRVRYRHLLAFSRNSLTQPPTWLVFPTRDLRRAENLLICFAMAGLKDTRSFFTKGNTEEWEYILSIYMDALKLKAQQKNKKPEELIKLDCWYQEELPKLIQSRKEKHLTHDELVQTMKWKLCRGKWRPRLTDLVRMNTPTAVLQVSKKAFRRLPNVASAIQTLSTLKGIGPATASAVLAAGAPELAPYMADECMLAIPECQSIDYTVEEYLIFSEQIQQATSRLNESDKNGSWTPHRVEKALWTYVVISEFNPSLIKDMRLPKDDTEALPGSQNGKPVSQADGEDSKDCHLDESVDLSSRNNGEKVTENNGDHLSSTSPAPPGGDAATTKSDDDNNDKDAFSSEATSTVDVETPRLNNSVANEEETASAAIDLTSSTTDCKEAISTVDAGATQMEVGGAAGEQMADDAISSTLPDGKVESNGTVEDLGLEPASKKAKVE